MRLPLPYAFVLVLCAPALFASEPCQQIHGRARLYLGDGQLRIWQISTHHEFEPADKASWDKLTHFLQPNGDWAAAAQYDLFADFTICPTKPFKAGAVQPAVVKNIQNPRILPQPRSR